MGGAAGTVGRGWGWGEVARGRGELRGRAEAAAAASTRVPLCCYSHEGGDGSGELLVALPVRHLDRGGPDERGQEDGAASSLVLLEKQAQREDAKGEKGHICRSSIFPIQLPALHMHNSCDRGQAERGGEVVAAEEKRGEGEGEWLMRGRTCAQDARAGCVSASAGSIEFGVRGVSGGGRVFMRTSYAHRLVITWEYTMGTA